MDNPFEGMTNGEVIKMMFPNIAVTEPREDYPFADVLLNGIRSFDAEWWNAPYEKREDV